MHFTTEVLPASCEEEKISSWFKKRRKESVVVLARRNASININKRVLLL
jgi:hypothetical protein